MQKSKQWTVKVYEAPDVRDAMAKQGNVIRISSPEQTRGFFEGQMRLYTQVARAARITPQ